VNVVLKAPVTLVPAQRLLASLTLNVIPVVDPPYVQPTFTVVPAAVTVGVPGVYRGVAVPDAVFDEVPDVD
jgi:hypothetical protein